MKGYQKKVDISKVKPPKCLVEYKIPEYEYRVAQDKFGKMLKTI